MAANNHETEFLLYTAPGGKIKVEVFLHNENLWLTQVRIAELFDVQRPAITKHLINIFTDGELEEDKVSSILEHTTKHGAVIGKTQTKQVKFYNLDAIIAVGYRVNSKRATQFRIWATQILKEYIIKGFAMNDERLKDPRQLFGQDYFEEQLARIRDIRSSERRFYQKITDIYSQCSIDYVQNEEITKNFFATVQNKLHFAITGQTAAEIIHTRVDSSKPHMGLTTWKNAPKGKIRKTEVGIEKIARHEEKLLHYATARLKEIPQLRIIGEAPQKAAVISFVFNDIHPHDVATILDTEGIAVRAGHHCAMHIMDRFQIPATTRASFAMYNTKKEIDALIEGLKKVRQIFA